MLKMITAIAIGLSAFSNVAQADFAPPPKTCQEAIARALHEAITFGNYENEELYQPPPPRNLNNPDGPQTNLDFARIRLSKMIESTKTLCK